MDYQMNKLNVACSSRRMDQLEKLIPLGYGETKDEVATYLFSRELDDLIRSGVIKPLAK